MPEPSQRHDYQRMVERGVIGLADELQGRMMVLFTSYAQLRETSRAITPRLSLGDIVVYDQSFGGSRDLLLESFKQAERAVLLGTRSFWEGVDIPGADLSALVIARLPFAVPSDPVFSARAETYSNSFEQYAVPDAILRFRQGFGRLIRSRNDRGVVAIFDRRIISKRYGRRFLESLPDCEVQSGPLERAAAGRRPPGSMEVERPTMKTPAGRECPHYYADYNRHTRDIEECRLAKSNPHSEQWRPNDCVKCPVPDIVLANREPGYADWS